MSAGRVAAGLGVLALGACTTTLVGPDPSDDPEVVFDLVWRDFDRHYVFFPEKALAWDSLYEVYRPRDVPAGSDAELAGAIGALLGELRDLHADLSTPFARYGFEGYDARPHDFTPTHVFPAYVPGSVMSPSTALRYGRFQAAPDVGYIWLAAFQSRIVADEFDVALSALGDVSGLVIDLRDNGGGTSDASDAVAGRFADSARIFAWTFYRTGPRHDERSEPSPLRLAPRGGRFARPVALLTNRHVVSSAERFVLAMRAIPGIIVIGDTTAGGSGIPATRELPNGWTYRLPQAAEYTEAMESYEVIGLAPDVVVRRMPSDSAARRDPVLERALVELRGTVGARAP
jgi:hypothetical protein